jgi:hypothetical protein
MRTLEYVFFSKFEQEAVQILLLVLEPSTVSIEGVGALLANTISILPYKILGLSEYLFKLLMFLAV